MNVTVVSASKCFVACFIVKKTVIGRDILNKLHFRFDVNNSTNTKSKVDEIMAKFGEVFDETLVRIQHSGIKLKFKHGTVPKFVKF